VKLVRLTRTVMDSVHTNMSALQILSLGEKALLAGSVEQLRLPLDGTYTDDGSRLTLTDPGKNREALMGFIYGE